MDRKVGKNIIYQTIYQILTIITPLITTPYISRVLGAEGVGFYSFTLTSASYFVLFAMMGLTNYGCRTIAKCQSDKMECSKNFWNIYSMQFFSSVIMLILYAIYIIVIVKNNKTIYLVQGITIAACLFDINWFFFGIEKFKLTVMRNIVIKLATVVCVLLFVNESTGVLGYALIMSFGTFISFLALWPFLRKEIVFVKPSFTEISIHVKPNLILFVPVLATSVFHVMDKTMLGSMTSYEELGYYTNADKVINIPMGIFNGLGTVFMPRVTALLNENSEKLERTLNDSLEIYHFFITALSFGLAGIALEFSPLFFGSEYAPCGVLIIMFAPVLVVKAYSGFFRMNVLIPFQKDRQYTIAVCVGAVVNFIANFIFISLYGAYGAVIGTFLAELTVFLVQLYKLPVHLDIRKVVKKFVMYLIFAIVMLLGIRLVAQLSISLFLKVITEIVLGGGIFICFCILFWLKNADSSFNLIINRVITKIKK